jgi:hypothetical protein
MDARHIHRHSRTRRRLAPSPAAVLSIIAIVLAMTGGAVAADKLDKDEVTVVTLTGGPVDTTSPNEDVTIPLTSGSDTFTFTQKAGEAVEVIATFDVSSQATFCNMVAFVYGVDLPLQARPQFDFKSEAGELGEGSAIGGLAAPAEDREVTLHAIARELGSGSGDGSGCDEEVEGVADSDTWSVGVTVSVVTLRS